MSAEITSPQEWAKSIANSAPVPQNEVHDIVTTVQKDDAATSLRRIMHVYTQSHLFLKQWKALNVDLDCLKRNLAMVRRFEASGLQLEGKGLWLLSMILQYGCDSVEIDTPTQTVLFDTLLRVAVETSASSICTEMMLLLIRKFHASCSHLFQTGCTIADQLPDSISADNFIALLSFAQVCIQNDPPCTLYACKFVVCLAASVTPNHKSNYFLHQVLTNLGTVLLAPASQPHVPVLPVFTPGEAVSNTDDLGAGAGDTAATNTTAEDIERKREIEVYLFVLFTYLVPLHPTHAQIIMNHPLRIPHHTIDRLRRDQLSEAGECAALLFLDALCMDTNAKDELKGIITVDMMRSKMSVFRPTVTEKATKLFLSLFAEDIECNYRSRSSVDLRELSHSYSNSHGHNQNQSNSLRGQSGVEGEEADVPSDARGSGRVVSQQPARSDCSWSISGVTCLRDLLGIVLSITEAALKSSTQNGAVETVGGAVDEGDSESIPRNSGAAFHYLNSVVYQVGLCVQIHRIYSLHDVVARIVALIMQQFENIAEFDLSNAKIIDSLFILVGMRERCWQPTDPDAIDQDYLNLSPALVEHFMSIADPLLTDSSDDRTLPSAPAPKDSAATNLLNGKVFNFAKDKFLKDASFLDNFIEEWEVESVETVCRKILLFYCRLQLGGFEAIADLVDLEAFEEVLWDLLSDDRHGMGEFPEMTRKCIQLFTAIGIHQQESTTCTITPGNSEKGGGGQEDGAPPKELAHAAPLAELVIKTLCSHEHASATDDDEDEFNANNMLLISGTASGKDSNSVKARTGPHQRTEGGKCVSRIFRTHKHILQLRYSCLSCVMHICETTRTVRRKVIGNYSEIVRNFSYLDPVKSMTPLLHLVALASEYLIKLESAGEESIVTLLVRCLRYPDAIVRTVACDVIAVIGASSPGLLHRGICRPEVEDLLLDILNVSIAEEEPQQYTGPLVRSVLKACNALTHDINLKPGWVPTPYTYHWSKYSSDVSTRPLFVPSFLDTLQLVVRRASRTYIVQYCALVLSIVTCLMYSCNDGVFSTGKSAGTHVVELKAALLSKFLPWMPVALDYLTSHRKILRSLLAIPAPASSPPPSSPASQSLSPVPEGSGHSSATTSPTVSPKNMHKTSTLISTTSPTSGTAPSGGYSEPSLETASDKDKDNNSSNSNSKQRPGSMNILGRIKRKSQTGNSNTTGTSPLVVENVLLPDRKFEVKYSLSAENLAEKLIEALHAFLCMDEMFPLSTYLQNAAMFNGTPVIACVSYFMTECKNNLRLQRRGIDFLRHFADNQIGLSSIAMHSPSAILHAARLLSDTLEVQYSFCKIVTAVARSDDFARENFIRFNVQGLLVEMVSRQHAEQSKLACVALTELCVTPHDIAAVCHSASVIEAIVNLLDSMPNDFKVQVEAMRVLVTADQVPEMMAPARKMAAGSILKKSKKFLTNALKQETLPDGYERADVERLLGSALLVKDPLLTKIMGFFG